jgi:endogenous inhibitor of DNA gyrase (YacG/DUF329 family)
MKHEKCYITIRRMCPECGKLGNGILIPSKMAFDMWICPNCDKKVEI